MPRVSDFYKAKNVCLTYQNLHHYFVTKQDCFEFIHRFFESFEPETASFTFGLEDNDSSKPDYEAYVLLQFPKRVQFRRTKLDFVFDHTPYTKATCQHHKVPNFLKLRNISLNSKEFLKTMREYCLKDEDYTFTNHIEETVLILL
jgi:hypothetical protein